MKKKKWDEYQLFASKDMAKSIRQLALLENYYKKTNSKLSSFIKAHKSKCAGYHPLNTEFSYGTAIFSKSNETGSLGDKCSKSAKNIQAYQREFVTPLEQQITQLRNRHPTLSIPISGGQLGSSKCFQGILSKATENPLDYVLYGKFYAAKKKMELDQAEKTEHYDPNCGTPLEIYFPKNDD